MFDSLYDFMVSHARAVAITGAIIVVLVLIAWLAGGFDIGFSRFFAVMDQDVDNSGGGGGGNGGGGAQPAVNPSASTASCGSKGGTSCLARTAGGCSGGLEDKGKTTDCDSGYGFCCGAAASGGGGSGSGGAGSYTDPTGNCIYKTNFNAPEGAWFCKSLQCQLDGNPSGGQQYPPEGPAVRMNIEMFGTICDQEGVTVPTVGCVQRLNATPKCGNNKECYPPKDPLWSCTGPIEMGRNGSDFYDCYVPRIHLTGPGQVTCTGNTGLPGDSITFTVVGPGGAPAGSVAPVATPTPDYPPPVCAPENSTVEVGVPARFTATGGSGAFAWDISGGGVVQEGGNEDVSIVWTIPGLKAVQVNSGGKNDRCTVQVGTVPVVTGEQDGRIGLTKLGRNLSLAEPEPHDGVGVSEGDIVQIELTVTNNTDEPLTQVLLRDTVPQGMSYRSGSLAVGGASIFNDDITTTGLAMGVLEPRDRAEITYSLIADNVGALAQGPQNVEARALVNTAEGTSAEAVLKLTIEGTGTGAATGGSVVSGAGTAETGPDDALVLALLVAAGSALLYAGYTRSPSFRRHEVEMLGRKGEPTDFRS